MPYLMDNRIQHYAWGQTGKQAFIPAFVRMPPEPDMAYAELWMGVHENGPSSVMVHKTSISLDQLIKNDPLNTLGKRVSEKFSNTLPFLLKILSAEEALSIQAHPDKETARVLHQKDPAHYPDANHKPEVAIALDALDALIGFKDFNEITKTFRSHQELSDLIEPGIAAPPDGASGNPNPPASSFLKSLYAGILRNAIDHPGQLKQVNEQIKNRLLHGKKPLTEEDRLFLDLEQKYTTTDLGLLMIFLLRRVHLKKGQGIAIGPGVPHAYLKGNIIECMANSDNVVRAGLTPKFKDRETLLQILDYRTEKIPVIGGDSLFQDFSYKAPFEEFELSKLTVTEKSQKIIASSNSPQILLVTEGRMRLIWRNTHQEEQMVVVKGRSVFIPACLETVTIGSEIGAEVFRVMVPDLNKWNKQKTDS